MCMGEVAAAFFGDALSFVMNIFFIVVHTDIYGLDNFMSVSLINILIQ